MRKNLVVGILKETKGQESRVPLTPSDVLWLRKRFVEVEVESASHRVYSDQEYRKAGAKIVKRFKKASLLVGIKEPEISKIYSNKTYMIFSHTIKGQKQNMPLLNAFLKKGVTLIDYEKIADTNGYRLVYFGKFAGVCGAIDSLCYLGRKLGSKGIENPFTLIQPAHSYQSFQKAKNDIKRVAKQIQHKGFNKKISPFIIGITGHGHVSKGVVELLDLLKPEEVHPRDIKKFARGRKGVSKRIYQIIFDREEKLRAKDGAGFYFEKYLQEPKKFESNMDKYLPHINLLLHTSYWDRRYPRLVTKKMINTLSRKPFRLEFIGDLSCDLHGSIEPTYKTTTMGRPAFTYNPKTKKYSDGYEKEGITILARDNLPSELPKDASKHFSSLVREYVYQLAAHGVHDVTNHVAIPREVRQAVIVQGKKLTKPYEYLKKHL